MTTLGERIKAYREMAKISQKDLAELCNMVDLREKMQSGGSLGLQIMRRIIEPQILRIYQLLPEH